MTSITLDRITSPSPFRLVSLAVLAEDTSTSQHAVDCSQSASLSLASWTVLAEELHRKRVGRSCATHPFSCSSIIQTPPFPVASRSDRRTPYSRDPPHLLFYSSPSAALTMGFPLPPLS